MTCSQDSSPQWQNRIVRYGEMPAHQFLANPANPRRHPAAQRDALRGSFDALGIIAPILINARTQFVIDGHARVEECLSRDENMLIPFIEVDLSEDEEALALASFDWITQMATYDRDMLDTLLQGIETDNEALQALLDDLASQNGIDLLDDAPLEDQGAQVDRAAELLEKWKCKRGDLWIIPSKTGKGEHRLLCGDSTNAADVARLMDGLKAQICFTSPPYNMGDNAKTDGHLGNGNISKYTVVDADNRTSDEYFRLLHDFTKNALDHCEYVIVNIQSLAANKITVIEYMHDWRNHFADVAIWNKAQAQPALAERVLTSAFEYIIILSSEHLPSRSIKTAQWARGAVRNVYSSGNNNGNEFADIHAAAFPLHLVLWGIENFSEHGKIIYEPFAGTGTTIIASEQSRRICHSIELEPTYCAVILERLSALGLTPRLDPSTHEIPF